MKIIQFISILLFLSCSSPEFLSQKNCKRKLDEKYSNYEILNFVISDTDTFEWEDKEGGNYKTKYVLDYEIKVEKDTISCICLTDKNSTVVDLYEVKPFVYLRF